MALAFTPDGAFIAGRHHGPHPDLEDRRERHPARQLEPQPPHPGWFSPKMNGESDEEDTHCLCWDANGQKLAYGANSPGAFFALLPLLHICWRKVKAPADNERTAPACCNQLQVTCRSEIDVGGLLDSTITTQPSRVRTQTPCICDDYIVDAGAEHAGERRAGGARWLARCST